MLKFPLPSDLAAAVRGDRSPERRAWLDRLEHNVATCAARWSLALGEPYEPGGQCSWVAPARNVRGEQRVLKVTYRHPEAEHEADALRTWAGRGAALLYEADSALDDVTAALLVERCPGPTLGSALPEPEQDTVIAGLLKRLWAAPHGEHAFRPLAGKSAISVEARRFGPRTTRSWPKKTRTPRTPILRTFAHICAHVCTFDPIRIGS